MTDIHVGCVSITWGKWRRQAPDEWPEERVLAEIAQAGYEGTTAGPRPDRTAQETIALYAQHGLKPAPGYFAAAFHEPEQRNATLEAARRQAAFAREVGLTELYVAPGGSAGSGYVSRANGKTRRELAGHVGPDDGLSDDENRRFADTLNETCRVLLDESGVRGCFHNHVGTVIETRDEFDRLLVRCDPDLVFLGPDTGHLAWAGADVTAFFRDYAPRILTAHLKDINADVRACGVAEEWDYGTFTANGVFTELGEGCVDFPALLDILRGHNFAGWLLAETDVTQKASALESATASRDHLRSIGL
jgi:inosose dehydratase